MKTTPTKEEWIRKVWSAKLRYQAVVTRAAINTDVQASLWCIGLESLGSILGNDTACSYGTIYCYGFINLHTDFHCGWTTSYPHQQCIGVPFTHILSTIGYVLTGVRWNLIVGLICLSLRPNEVEHIFDVFISYLYFIFWELSIFWSNIVRFLIHSVLWRIYKFYALICCPVKSQQRFLFCLWLSLHWINCRLQPPWSWQQSQTGHQVQDALWYQRCFKV